MQVIQGHGPGALATFPASGVIASAGSLATYTTLHADSPLSLTDANLPNGIRAAGYARTVDSLKLDTPGVALVGFTLDVDAVRDSV
jgi:hypothetical protein